MIVFENKQTIHKKFVAANNCNFNDDDGDDVKDDDDDDHHDCNHMFLFLVFPDFGAGRIELGNFIAGIEGKER